MADLLFAIGGTVTGAAGLLALLGMALNAVLGLSSLPLVVFSLAALPIGITMIFAAWLRMVWLNE